MLRILLPSLLLIACGDKNEGDALVELDIEQENEPSGEPSIEASDEPAAEPDDSTDPLNIDDDGDGFTENQGDCNDNEAMINPNAAEYCDGFDSNCNDIIDENPVDGFDYYLDVDGDGYGSAESEGKICEIPDGYADNNLDCNDAFAEINPEGIESCGDALDNDCNGQIDEGPLWYEDSDGDGYGDLNASLNQCEKPAGYVSDNTDCAPTNPSIFPNAPEISGDGIDQDCNGVDADPYNGTEQFIYAQATTTGAYDCDLSWSVSGTQSSTSCPDCSYVFDLNMTFDSASSTAGAACSSIAADETYTYGFVADYDGNNNSALLLYDSTNGWQPWIVNGTINGNSTDVVSMNNGSFSYQTGYLDYQYQGYYESDYWLGNASLTPSDLDGDGILSDIDCDDNDASSTTTLIDQDCDTILTTADCNDTDAELGAIADDLDCDGLYNSEDCAPNIFSTQSNINDADCDGTPTAADCDDNDPERYNGATEIPYDGIDQDCDEQDLEIDNDNDGENSLTDCDDNDPIRYHGATDTPNDGIDQDCDGVDSTVAVDNDGDGEDTLTDCDDYDATIYTGAPEIPSDGIDQDCDGYDSAWPYLGTEDFHYADGTTTPSNLECDMHWDVSGVPSSIACADCAFVFDLEMTYDSSSVSSANCASSAMDSTYTYGFTSDYDGNGNSAISYYDSVNGWVPWIVNGTTNPDGSTDVVSISGASFTYSSGYQDYQYQGYYYTNYWFGNATLEGEDDDGDGSLDLLDCDDSDATINPSATEIPYDGIDQDCDGQDLEIDNDNDGENSLTDCDDSDANIYTGATEIPNDGIDQDCDGVDLTCQGFEIIDCQGSCVDQSWLADGYCDDGSYPYNGTLIYLDCSLHNFDQGDCPIPGADGDGDGDPDSTDCEPNDATIYTGATEIPNDGIDQDCDGLDLITNTMTYTGTESFTFEDDASFSGTYQCELSWSVSGTTSGTPCSNCAFAFDLEMTYDAVNSILGTSCISLAADDLYTYGFIQDYDGNGNSAISYYDSANGWVPWIVNGTTAPGSTDIVNINGTSFSYQTGYQDYLYQNTYYTNIWVGLGNAQ